MGAEVFGRYPLSVAVTQNLKRTSGGPWARTKVLPRNERTGMAISQRAADRDRIAVFPWE